MKKKLASLLTAAALAVSLCVPALAAATPFTDISTHWGRSYVERAYALNFVKGTSDTTFTPDEAVSTAQLATMMTKVFFTDSIAEDVPGAPWWAKFVAAADKAGLLEGTSAGSGDDVHAPLLRQDADRMLFNLIAGTPLYASVTQSARQEAAAALKDFDRIPQSYREAVTTCYALGLMRGNDQGLFRGEDSLNRAQSAVIMCNLYDLLDREGLLDDFGVGKPVPPAPQPQPSEFTQFQLDVLRIANEERAKEGIAPLKLDATLCRAAQIRTQELPGQFSHTRPNGTRCFTVLDEVGFSGQRTAGENIAAGYGTAEAFMDGWMHSQGHRANIMNPEFELLGVGFTQADDIYGTYSTQLFAGMW